MRRGKTVEFPESTINYQCYAEKWEKWRHLDDCDKKSYSCLVKKQLCRHDYVTIENLNTLFLGDRPRFILDSGADSNFGDEIERNRISDGFMISMFVDDVSSVSS